VGGGVPAGPMASAARAWAPAVSLLAWAWISAVTARVRVGEAQQGQARAGASQVTIHRIGAGRQLRIGGAVIGAQRVRAVSHMDWADDPGVEQGQTKPNGQPGQTCSTRFMPCLTRPAY